MIRLIRKMPLAGAIGLGMLGAIRFVAGDAVQTAFDAQAKPWFDAAWNAFAAQSVQHPLGTWFVLSMIALVAIEVLSYWRGPVLSFEVKAEEPKSLNIGPGKAAFSQLWFTNDSDGGSESSIARHTSVILEFWGEPLGARNPIRVHGQWTETVAPGHWGFVGFGPVRDLPPNDIPNKVLVALRYDTERDAYVAAHENMHAYPDWRHPNYALPIGTYIVKVRVRGVGVSRTNYFELINPGRHHLIDLRPKSWLKAWFVMWRLRP